MSGELNNGKDNSREYTMKEQNEDNQDIMELEIPDLPCPGKSWLIGWTEEDQIFDDKEFVEKVGNRTYLVVIIYDIVDNKRRSKMAKTLLGYGERVQRSAFECHLTLRKYEAMISDALMFIDQKEDLLRVYRLAGNTEVRMWGNVPETVDDDVIII